MSLIYPLLVAILLRLSETVIAEDECQKDADCTDVNNSTLSSCCHRKLQSSECRETCVGESCIISWDCGTAQELFCCSNPFVQARGRNVRLGVQRGQSR